MCRGTHFLVNGFRPLFASNPHPCFIRVDPWLNCIVAAKNSIPERLHTTRTLVPMKLSRLLPLALACVFATLPLRAHDAGAEMSGHKSAKAADPIAAGETSDQKLG